MAPAPLLPGAGAVSARRAPVSRAALLGLRVRLNHSLAGASQLSALSSQPARPAANQYCREEKKIRPSHVRGLGLASCVRHSAIALE